MAMASLCRGRASGLCGAVQREDSEMTRPTINDSTRIELLPYGHTAEEQDKIDARVAAGRRGLRLTLWQWLALGFALAYICGWSDGRKRISNDSTVETNHGNDTRTQRPPGTQRDDPRRAPHEGEVLGR